MRAHIELRSNPSSDTWSLVVTHDGPNGFRRGWSTQFSTLAEGVAAEWAARQAASNLTTAVEHQRPTHGCVPVRWTMKQTPSLDDVRMCGA